MNNSQFSEQLFNQDNVYPAETEYNIAFNGYNLMSFNCAYYSGNIVHEATLQDVYGSVIYDFQGVPLTVMEMGRLTYQLQNADVGVAVQKGNVHDIVANITSSISSLADGGSIIDKKYNPKTITLLLFVQGATHNDLIARIDDLKKNTQGIEGDFDINVGGTVRRYEATVTSITVPSFGKLDSFVEGIEMEMIITSPHWRYKNLSQQYLQGMTSNFSKLVTNEGTYKANPIIQVITNAGSTLSGISIEMKKVGESSGYTIEITETINPGAVVIFDFIEKTVTVNDVEVNFSGVMMPMQVGQSVFSFEFTGSVDVNAYILHYPTFL